MSTDRKEKESGEIVTTCNINQEIWLDYVEGELETSFKKDLSLHLKECDECQRSYAEFRVVRRLLHAGDVKTPADSTFDKLEAKIMASLDKEVADVKPIELRRPFSLRRFAIPTAAAAALFLLIAGSLFTTPSFKNSNDSVAKHDNLEEQFVEQTASSTHSQFYGDGMITHQDEDDMVLDAAAAKLSRMSDTEARTMLDNMK